MHWRLASACACLATLLLHPILLAQSPNADLIMLHGHILTVDTSDSVAQAIAIALRSYTVWASRQMFLENKIGTLEVGKKADIAIWDRDLYSIPIDQIKDLKCLMTLLDGEVVYSSPDSPASVSVR